MVRKTFVFTPYEKLKPISTDIPILHFTTELNLTRRFAVNVLLYRDYILTIYRNILLILDYSTPIFSSFLYSGTRDKLCWAGDERAVTFLSGHTHMRQVKITHWLNSRWHKAVMTRQTDYF